MALLDIVTNPANLSTIIEFIGLASAVYLFFRRATEENTRQNDSIKSKLEETKTDLLDRLEASENRLCNKISETQRDVNRLEDRFYDHLSPNERYRYPKDSLSNNETEKRKNGKH